MNMDEGLEDLKKKSIRRKRGPCNTAKALRELGKKEDKDLFEKALEVHSDDISSGALLEWLEERGITCGTSTSIKNHRDKRCACYA